MKRCKKCNLNKPESNFTVNKYRKDGLNNWCKDCDNQRQQKWRDNNRDKLKIVAKRYWKKNKKEINKRASKRYSKMAKAGMCTYCGQQKAANGFRQCQSCNSIRNKRAIKYRKKLRDEVYSHYGGYKCACCGETEPVFLTIDHINNDGAKHRVKMAHGRIGRTGRGCSGIRIYYWLKRHNYPLGFQVLCYNCNHGKYLNGGICPHQKK